MYFTVTNVTLKMKGNYALLTLKPDVSTNSYEMLMIVINDDIPQLNHRFEMDITMYDGLIKAGLITKREL